MTVKWFDKSFPPPNCSKSLAHSRTKQVTVFVSHWVIHSNDSFKNADSLTDLIVTVFTSESSSHSFKTQEQVIQEQKYN